VVYGDREAASEEMIEALTSRSKSGTHRRKTSESPDHPQSSRSRSAHSGEEKDLFGSMSEMSTSEEEEEGDSIVVVQDSPHPEEATGIPEDPRDMEPTTATTSESQNEDTATTGDNRGKGDTATVAEK